MSSPALPARFQPALPLPSGRRKGLALALAALLPAVAPALAQQQEAAHTKPLEEIVVISSRIPIPLRQIGTSVSVISAADIEERGNLNLTDVLRQLPAVGVSNSGGAGQSTSLRIRGEEGFRTLTIMDGLRLSDPSAPQVGPQLEHLLSSGISRIEILRGPQGLGYGADAGGVLNISTRNGSEGLQAGLDLQGGSFGTRQASATLAGANSTADFFVAASRFDSDGFNALAADTVFADKDGYNNDTLHLRGGLNLGEQWRLELVRRQIDGETRYDNCFSPTNGGNDCLAVFEQRSTRLALDYEGSSIRHSLSYNRNDTERDNYSSGAISFGAQGELERWEYIGSASGLPGFNLVWGADLETALNNGEGRDNTGLYLEYLSDFSESLYLTAGLRHDDNDDFGSNTSHRLSAAWLMDLQDDATLKFKASHGSGFRAPSPYEVQYNRGSWAYPPASLVQLQQESSKGWEAGVEYVQGYSVKLEAVWFRQQVEDAIIFDPVTWSGYLQDIGTSRSQGLELSAEIGLGEHWRLTGNYTWNDTERPDGQQRLRRPKQLLNAGLSWYGLAEQRLNLNAFLRASRDSIDELSGSTTALPDFAVLDLTANLRLNDTLQLYGRIENVLDEDYQEIIGYNAAERAAYVGFRLSYTGL
jgi:vitamin B12 transporter